MSELNTRYRRSELRQPGAVETWAGLDRTLNRPVTIRRAAADSEIGHRLRLQAKALARVEHHGLLHILDTYDETHDGMAHFAIVTEQLPLRILADELTTPEGDARRLTAAEAVRVTIAVTEALATLHDVGFAHGGVEAEHIGWRAEVGWVILNGPPTDDAVAIPATRGADLRSLAVLAHRLMAGAEPQQRADGATEIDPAVPDVVAPVLARAISADDPWPDLGSMLLALRSIENDLPSGDAAADEAEASMWRSERSWLAPVGVLVAAAATLVGVALALDRPGPAGEQAATPLEGAAGVAQQVPDDPSLIVDQDPEGNDELSVARSDTVAGSADATPPEPAEPQRFQVELGRITDFDPQSVEGDGEEHPNRLGFINDGDSTTGWSTVSYRTRDFGRLKDGVGLIVELAGDGPHQVERLEIDAGAAVGWAVEIYVSSSDYQPGSEDWGAPVAADSQITGSTTLNLAATDVAELLIWITDLGDALRENHHVVTIKGIRAFTTEPPEVSDEPPPPSPDA